MKGDAQESYDDDSTPEDVAEPVFLPPAFVEPSAGDTDFSSSIEQALHQDENPILADPSIEEAKAAKVKDNDAAPVTPAAAASAPKLDGDNGGRDQRPVNADAVNAIESHEALPQQQETSSTVLQPQTPVWTESNSYVVHYPELLSTPDPALVSARNLIHRGRSVQADPATVCLIACCCFRVILMPSSRIATWPRSSTSSQHQSCSHCGFKCSW